jgi:hypothetical protein
MCVYYWSGKGGVDIILAVEMVAIFGECCNGLPPSGAVCEGLWCPG